MIIVTVPLFLREVTFLYLLFYRKLQDLSLSLHIRILKNSESYNELLFNSRSIIEFFYSH